MRRFRWLAFVCVIALVLAACGRSDKETGSNNGTQTSTDTQASGGASKGSFGTSDVVCQPGTPSGSPANGVSASEIHLATFSDVGFAGRPGLNQELFDAATVFSKWCNDAGGINGRKIVVDERDAALTNVKAKMVESCASDFMVVGGGAVFDQDGVETRLTCLMPEISGYSVSPQARGADLLVQPIPNTVSSIPIGDYLYLEKKYPKATKAYGVLTGDIDTTKIVARQGDEAAKSLGWTKVYDDVYPPTGPADWTPLAQQLKDKGVKALLWTGEPENLAKLMQALSDINYTLDFVRTDANHYDDKLIDTGGSAIKNVFVRSVFTPFELAKKGNATQEYLDAFAKYLPNGKANALLGVQAWSAWMLFATAANDCGNDLTRKCVFENATKLTEWTGGGLHAAVDLKANVAPACFTEMEASASGFKIVSDLKPTEGIFRCEAKGVYTLKGDYPKGVTLADVGKSMADLK
ncbi:MAG: ABC transporter substrate-binding protein [Acidimicrobiia bacterium]|nr:ABC transporter substrate-binding protein [Acidimicrobiia bacterium]